jgi:hypothetical protein
MTTWWGRGNRGRRAPVHNLWNKLSFLLLIYFISKERFNLQEKSIQTWRPVTILREPKPTYPLITWHASVWHYYLLFLYIPRDFIRRPHICVFLYRAEDPFGELNQIWSWLHRMTPKSPFVMVAGIWAPSSTLSPSAVTSIMGWRNETHQTDCPFVTEGTLGVVQSEVAVPPFRTRVKCTYSFKKERTLASIDLVC